jgi:hypothetical protein
MSQCRVPALWIVEALEIAETFLPELRRQRVQLLNLLTFPPGVVAGNWARSHRNPTRGNSCLLAALLCVYASLNRALC